MAPQRVVLVQIGPADRNGPMVDPPQALVDVHGAEAEARGLRLHHLAVAGVGEGEREGVDVRPLRRPRRRLDVRCVLCVVYGAVAAVRETEEGAEVRVRRCENGVKLGSDKGTNVGK